MRIKMTEAIVTLVTVSLAFSSRALAGGHTPEQNQAIKQFKVQGFGFGDSLSDFRTKFPDAERDAKHSHSEFGLELYSVVTVKGVDRIGFSFFDGSLYQMTLFYLSDTIDDMGGWETLAERLVGRFGKADEGEAGLGEYKWQFGDADKVIGLHLFEVGVTVNFYDKIIGGKLADKRNANAKSAPIPGADIPSAETFVASSQPVPQKPRPTAQQIDGGAEKRSAFSDFVGTWVVCYENEAIRIYTITRTGEVSFSQENSRGQLVRQAGYFLLSFGDGKTERITLQGARLSVDHYDPRAGAKFPDGPSTRGTGTRETEQQNTEMEGSSAFSSVAGTWVVRYENKATRIYTITRRGEVSFSQENSRGQLVRQAGYFLVSFGDGKTERITLQGARLLVDHYDPRAGAKFPNGPSTRGTGTRETK